MTNSRMMGDFSIPSPNFNSVIVESAIKKPNPWLQVIEERSHMFGSKRHKSDYDKPQEKEYDDYWFCENNFGENNQQSHKTQKVDKRDVESYEYFCDACDRGFKTNDQYSVHNSQHEECRAKDCNYVAAPKLVKLHYNMQHVTGLANKIKESSVDLEKWREERRRNFPTAANIQKKEQEMRDRMERGEVLETKQFGKMRGRGRGRGHRGQRGHRGRGSWDQRSGHNHNQYSNTSREDYSSDPLSRLDFSTGDGFVSHTSPSMTALHTEHDKSIGTQSKSTQPTTSSNAGKATAAKAGQLVSGGLGSLISSYGDVLSSDDEGGEIKEPPKPRNTASEVPKSVPAHIPQSQKAQAGSALSDNKTAGTEGSQPEEVERFGNHRNRHRKNNNTIKSQQKQQQKSVTQCKSSLLEKLLASEIRHERNVLLQCVRHVVQNEFFGVGVKKGETLSCATYADDDNWE